MNDNNIANGRKVLVEWASAIRGDWGGIDGRACRDQIESIDALMDEKDDVPLETFREAGGICPSGKGHWTWFCDSECDPDLED